MFGNLFDDSKEIWLRRVPVVVLSALCLGTYFFVVQGAVDKPFTTDEIYYAGWAYGISQTGSPVYYTGEDTRIHTKWVEPISHPTLHFNLLAVMILIFGPHYWSLRLLGVVFFVALLLFLRFVVFKRDPYPNDRLVFAGLLLVFNPLFMQQSMVLAIEAQAFWFPMFVFLYVFHRESFDTPRFRYFPYIGTLAMMVVLLWFKETNAPIYVVVCTFYLIIAKRLKRIPFYLLSVLAAVGLFWGSWVLYCQVTDVDVYSWWNFTVVGKMAKGEGGVHRILLSKGLGTAVTLILRFAKVPLTWISFPYVVLYFLAIVVWVRDFIRGQRAVGFIDLCLLYALVLFASTRILRPTDGFIKYENPAHMLMAIVVADVFFSRFRKAMFSFVSVTLVAVIAGIGLYATVPDRVLEIRSYYQTHVLQGVAIAAGVAVVFWGIQRKMSLTPILLGLLAGIVTLNMNLFVHQSLNGYTTGLSWNNYGQDLAAPTKWLEKHLENGEAFAAFKDMQFNMRFIEGKSESPTYEARTFTKLRGKRRTKERILRSGQIKYFVLSKYSDTRFGRKFLEKNNYRRIKRIKGHIIYERTKCPYCQKRRGRNRPS